MVRPVDWWVLDLDADPTPGDADEVRRLVAALSDFATDADLARKTVATIADDSVIADWVGKSGDAYRDRIGDLPGQLNKAATSYQMCADALAAYAPKLADAQHQADAALAAGRAARAALATATNQLATDQAWASHASSAATTAQTPPAGQTSPDPDQVAAAVRNAAAANARVSADHTAVSNAQTDLDHAKTLAAQAASLRDQAAHTAVTAIKHASDAGIHNEGFWSHLGHSIASFASTAWHDLVEVCKVLVVVLGVAALILGGPLAWALVAVAAVVLIDTIVKYAQGKASLLDVFFAALACIPMTEGLTSIDALTTAFKDGGMVGAGLHLAGAAKTTATETGRALTQFAANAPAKLARMTAQIREGVPAAADALLDGSSAAKAYRDGFEAFQNAIELTGDPTATVDLWQGGKGFYGIDDWSTHVAKPGDVFVGGYPHPSGFTVPAEQLARVTDASGAVSGSKFFEGVQVAQWGGTYRDSYVFYEVTDRAGDGIAVAKSTALTNTQYGAGGLEQAFIPNIGDHIAAGTIQPYAILDDGARIDLKMAANEVDASQVGQLNHFADNVPTDGLPAVQTHIAAHTHARTFTTRGSLMSTGVTADSVYSGAH